MQTTIWSSPTEYVTVDPSLRIEYPSVNHPSTIVKSKTRGGSKWISVSLRLPENITIEEVIVCYQVSNPRSFISQIRLSEMSTPDQARVRHDDGAALQSPTPARYSSIVPGVVPAPGAAMMLQLRLNFQDAADRIYLGAVGVRVVFQVTPVCSVPCTQVNVVSYGADPSGVADSYAAIQRAVAAINAAGGGWLVFPPGTYAIKQYRVVGGASQNSIQDFTFSSCRNLLVSGYGAKIDVKGNFHKAADYKLSDRLDRSYSQSVSITFHRCSNVVIEGLEIDGNVDQTTRAGTVVENSSYGIVVSGCDHVTFRDLNIHHFSTDNLIVTSANPTISSHIRISGCAFSSGARHNVAITQARNVYVSKCHFFGQGFTNAAGTAAGAYGSHQGAGVDIEMDYTPPVVDDITGGIVFSQCSWGEGVGGLFSAAQGGLLENITIRDSQFDSGASQTSWQVILAANGGLLENCYLNLGAGTLFPSWSDAGADVDTTVRGCTLAGDNRLLTADHGTPLLVENNRFVGTHAAKAVTPYVFFRSAAGTVRSNYFWVPAAAYNDAGTWTIIVVMQNLRFAGGNTFATDYVTPTGQGRHLAAGYESSLNVRDERFVSPDGTSFRESANSMRDQGYPFTRGLQVAGSVAPNTLISLPVAGDAIPTGASGYAHFLALVWIADVTLTATPMLEAGLVSGQLFRITNVGAYSLTLQDDGTLVGSNVKLSANTITLGTYDSIEFCWIDRKWVQVGLSNVL